MDSIPRTSGIYKITCTVNGKIYVGSAINLYKRLQGHQWELRNNRHTNIYLQRAWNKYGESAFTFEVIELVMPWSRFDRENYWLKTLKPFDKNIGFNTCKTAGEIPSQKGRLVSDETRAKMSRAAQNRGMQPEAIEAMRRANAGKKHTPEHIEKVAAVHRGKKIKPEQLEKMTEATSRNYIATSPNGIEIRVRNLSKFCRDNGLNNKALSNVAYGFCSHHKGWKCRRDKE